MGQWGRLARLPIQGIPLPHATLAQCEGSECLAAKSCRFDTSRCHGARSAGVEPQSASRKLSAGTLADELLSKLFLEADLEHKPGFSAVKH